jgi:hypothetical protein
MISMGMWANHPVTISVKPNCLTISIDGPVEAEVFSYDYEGRLWTAYLDSVSYRRGLNGRIIAKWRLPGNERERYWLPPDEALQIEERARQRVADLYAALQANTAHLKTPLSPQGMTGFERAIAFDAARSQADAARYLQVYKPVGILPPDQYMAVVLQVTEGCAFNTCTFCNFYKERPFHIKAPEELRAHAQAVRDFLGEGLNLRRTIFLGDANALIVPMPKLLPLIDVIHDVYNVEALGGIYAFLDGFSGEKKSEEDYRALAARGLTRIYVGMESGSDALLKFLKKPGSAEDVVQAINSMKAGGLAVGVIVLLGAGGHQYAKAHVAETIVALNRMSLDMDDIIYFSELVVSEGLEYAEDAYAAGLRPLSQAERTAQEEAITRGLKFSGEGGTPHISRYDIREFVY